MTQTTKQILALWSDTTECKDTETAIADFYHAAIASYKAELLNEVGEPVLYAEFAEVGGWLGDASEYADHLEEPHALFTSDQLAAAILKATGPLENQLAKAEQLWQVAQGRCDGLEEKLATAEQRVAEACAALADYFEQKADDLNDSISDDDDHNEGRSEYIMGKASASSRMAKSIRSGEYRKYMKEV